MQKINTKKFGEIDIDETKIINMPKGLPGFIGYNKYVILDHKDIQPFCWFQCIEEPDLALVVMNPFLFKKDYKTDLKSAIKEMEWNKKIEDKLEIYVVINIKKGKKKNNITANLLSPIVINPLSFEAIQVIDPNPKDISLYNYPIM